MMATVIEIALLRLWNNKQELLLTVLVPIAFFSIFALIFGRGVGTETPPIAVAIVDDDGTRLTKAILQELNKQTSIAVHNETHPSDQGRPIEQLARAIMRDQRAEVVIHFPPGLEQRLRDSKEVTIRLLNEGTNPGGRQIVHGLLSRAVGVALAKRGGIISWWRARQLRRLAERIDQSTDSVAETSGGDVSGGDAPADETVAAAQRPQSNAVVNRGGSSTGNAGRRLQELISLQSTDVYAMDKRNPIVAMYAAGIAVMFLLFSATGAGGSLLEEQEAGTLDRLLASRLGITQLLAGKWLYITCLGCVQLTVMFVWAQFVFGVDLVGHLSGFTVMTLCTAAATASLAVLLAVVCHSRTQLQAISIVLILAMSALGGSMVPRYIMSEQLQRWGQFTFNAWALDGFKKVFWYDLPLQGIAKEITVLLVITVVLAVIARGLADRWATA